MLRLCLQVFLVVCLWRGLYAQTEVSSGLNREQAVSYAVLATLMVPLRGMDRLVTRDTVLQHVQYGTIAYWFLRPLHPARYHLLRAVGEQCYGFCWVLLGYSACLISGIVAPPTSTSAGLAFAVSLLFGQLMLYLLFLLIDLLCFWTVMNQAARLILQFTQNLLSGAFAPLWFFPPWFLAMSSFLPFQGTLNTPLSLYVGRIPVSAAVREIAVQAVWCALLAVASHSMWRWAGRRVMVQGG
jgi:ABC-2 type transport system permease protein